MKPSLELVKKIVPSKKELWNVSWSPCGSFLSTTSSDKSVKIFNKELKLSQTFDKHARTARQSTFSPNGKFFATCSFDSNVYIYTLNKNSKKYDFFTKLDGHQKEVKSISWSKDSNYIATCSRDRTIWIWEFVSKNNTKDFECCSVLKDHTADVKFVKFHPKKNILFSCSFDDTLRIWKEGKDDWFCDQILEEHNSTVWQFDFNHTCDYMVSCSDDKSIIIWKENEKNGKWESAQRIKDAALRAIYSVSWLSNKNNDVIVIGSSDNSIRLFGVKNGVEKKKRCEYELKNVIEDAHKYDVNCVSWNPMENLLASCSDDGDVKFWKLSN